MAALLNPLTDQPYTAKQSLHLTAKGHTQQYCQFHTSNEVPFFSAGNAADVWKTNIVSMRGIFEFQFPPAVQQEVVSIQAVEPIVLGAGETLVYGEVRPETSESLEVRWLRDNRRLLDGYRGEWLLILGGELVTHNSNFREIREAIAERGIRSPFTYYVPTNEESEFILI